MNIPERPAFLLKPALKKEDSEKTTEGPQIEENKENPVDPALDHMEIVRQLFDLWVSAKKHEADSNNKGRPNNSR